MKFLREDAAHGPILIYSLKYERNRGRDFMVNDVMIRIENAHGSYNDLSEIADKIMSALNGETK